MGVLIETERLCLRPMTLTDLDAFLVLPYAPPPFDRRTAIGRLRADAREWQSRGHGMAAILHRADGRFLGRVALNYSPQTDETWFGAALHRHSWGRGYAIEAASAYIGWAFRDLGLGDVSAMVSPESPRSIRLVERLGMTARRTLVSSATSVEVVYVVACENWPPDRADPLAAPDRDSARPSSRGEVVRCA